MANDIDAVIEQLANDLWESRRGGTQDDYPRAETSEYWKRTFRDFAATAVEKLHPDEGRHDIRSDTWGAARHPGRDTGWRY
jgi:hypothetical protein